MEPVSAHRIFHRISGLCLMIFPFMLLAGFLLHPDLFSFRLVRTPDQLVANFHHQWMFHVGHLIVSFSIPFITVAIFFFTLKLTGKGFRYGLLGGALALLGATALGLDKGSLCLVLSGFDTLPESQFQQLTPFLQVLIDKKGLLVVNWLFILLPLGFILQIVGLIRQELIAKTSGVLTIIGLLLLINPDIEIISTVGTILMIVGLVPLGWKYYRQPSLAASGKN
ncbi:MAG: hypothetical protein OER04_19635 [Cyclobacteriaceae bacterium]|nr:hypothetical protein [Cyclobacteriaceae bacterium]